MNGINIGKCNEKNNVMIDIMKQEKVLMNEPIPNNKVSNKIIMQYDAKGKFATFSEFVTNFAVIVIA